MLYAAAGAARAALYGIGVLRTTRVGVPVVVVGNLIAGGAGKTPVVIAVVAALRRAGYTPGIVSRGYGGSATGEHEVTRASAVGECGDEPLLLQLRTGAPVVVGRDRVAAVRHLRERHPRTDIVVTDDGLQHVALGRDVQVLVFDERGVGNGWLLPAGPLRERLPRDTPTASLVVYNAPGRSTPLPGHLAHRQLGGAVALADWWAGRPATAQTLAGLRGRPLVAAAGLARPERFFAMLRDAGLEIEPLPLPDHHDFARLPWTDTTPDVIVTEKDAVKLDPVRTGSTRVWVAPLDLRLDADFDAALIALLPPPGTHAHGNAIA